MPFLLAFVLVAFVELAIFVWAWSAIGAGWTVGLTLATGIVGAYLVRHQGFTVYGQFRERLQAGGFPGKEIAHGAMVLVGAAFLLTPGFLTDVVGFTLMWYPAREAIRRFGEKRLRNRTSVIVGDRFGSGAAYVVGEAMGGTVIDGSLADDVPAGDESVVEAEFLDERFLD